MSFDSEYDSKRNINTARGSSSNVLHHVSNRSEKDRGNGAGMEMRNARARTKTRYDKQSFEEVMKMLKSERNENTSAGFGLRSLASVVPLLFLLMNVAWSALCVFAITRDGFVTDWLAVPDAVTSAFGMALVILLAFAVSEATARHRTAVEQLYTCAHALRHTARHALLVYPEGTWISSADTHRSDGGKQRRVDFSDRCRLLAHLAAYPVALALTLTHIHHHRHASADMRARVVRILERLLSDMDLKYVLAAPQPHLRCSAVARSYFTAADEGSVRNFSLVAASKSPAGSNGRFHAVTLVDAIDTAAATVTRIARFRPAKGYRLLLRIFTIIWTAFVPLSILRDLDSPWFTLLWSFLVTYSIATVLAVATALDSPFSTNMTSPSSTFSSSFSFADYTTSVCSSNAIGVPVLPLCAGFANDVIMDIIVSPSYGSVLPSSDDAGSESEFLKSIKPDDFKAVSEKAYGWLESSLPHEAAGYSSRRRSSTRRSRFVATLRAVFRPSWTVAAALLVFTVWSAAIVLLTWGLSQRRETPRGDGDRWWSVQIPLSSTTLGYVGTAMFLLLSFWTTNAFARFFRSLQLWTVTTRINLETFVHLAVLILKPGYWHFRDHERLLSYVAALPIAMKLHLRGVRNIAEIKALVGDVDAQRFANDPRPYPIHCMDVIHAYINAADSADSRFVNEDERPFLTTGFTMQNALWNADRALWECVALNNAPISPIFTLHLKIFVAIWLALLPAVVVQQSGFVSFVFLVPIAYSVINLVYTADRIRDPFGCDEEDIPLNAACDNIRDSIHRIYLDTHNRKNETVIPLDERYRREDLQPKRENYFSSSGMEKDNNAVDDGRGRSFATPTRLVSAWRQLFNGFDISPLMVDDLPTVRDHRVRLTFFDAVKRRLQRFPTISLKAYVFATLWAVAAVFISWGLSELWEGQNRGDCRVWCSPVDVDGPVLANIGFVLFLITSFRAADALQRFDMAANMLFEVARRTRGLAVEFSHVFPVDFFHSATKERVVAHVVQIPLCLSDMLHNGGLGRESANHGLLSSTDRQRFVSNSSPMEYLLETVQAYVAVQDSTAREGWDLAEFRASPSMAGSLFAHIAALRTIVAQTTTLKHFPEVGSYNRLERVFTIIWLGLLPLSLAPDLGFFTILWSPIISYGVLAVQDFAAQLADPFGCDAGDLPLRALCTQAVDITLDAINSTGWDTNRLCAQPTDLTPSADGGGVGALLRDARVYPKIYPPSLDSKDSSHNSDEAMAAHFALRALPRPHASFFAHIRCSIPWRAIFLSLLWAIAVCTVQEVTIARDNQPDGPTDRWWMSTVNITISVVNGVSFGTFLLLGFFATAAFGRYDRGGAMWETRVRPACHQLASTLLIYVHEGIVHHGDVRRLIGLVAAFPLLLRAELRDVRDLREVSCLLTSHDLARIAYSENMPMYCLDTIRAYIIRVVSHKDLLLSEEPVPPRSRSGFVRTALASLEEAIQEARFLKTFGVSPVFRILLKMLLTIFLALVPFILYIRSGTHGLNSNFYTNLIMQQARKN